jgi:hypothetical protein
MAFKEYDTKPTFLDIILQRSFGHSQSQQFLTEVNEPIYWDTLEKLVTEHYPVGQSDYGNKAYPPLMLLKALFNRNILGLKLIMIWRASSMIVIPSRSSLAYPSMNPLLQTLGFCHFEERK